MTKEELVITLSKKTGIEREMVSIVVDALATEVSMQLLAGNTVHMRGFGTFTIKHRKTKIARLINKRRKLIIPAHDQPYFKPSQRLRDEMRKRTTFNPKDPEE